MLWCSRFSYYKPNGIMFLLGKHFRGYLKNYSTKQIKSLHAGLVFFFFFKEWKTV